MSAVFICQMGEKVIKAQARIQASGFSNHSATTDSSSSGINYAEIYKKVYNQ